MSQSLTIDVPDTCSAIDIQRYVENALRQYTTEIAADPQLDVDLTQSGHYQHPEWEDGDVCPNCGSKEFVVGMLGYELCRVADDWMDFVKMLDYERQTKLVECANEDCRCVVLKSLC